MMEEVNRTGIVSDGDVLREFGAISGKVRNS